MPRPAFTGTKPKAYNRRFFIDIGTEEEPLWVELCHGIASRGVDVGGDTEEYYYMCGEGSADVETSSQTVTRTFTGNRFLGDPAQDAIFIDMMYNLDNRSVRFIDYYENPPTSWTGPPARGNGWQGNASIQIQDDGGGDAGVRETISFSLLYNGAPTRGTVVVNPDTNIPTFTPLAA